MIQPINVATPRVGFRGSSNSYKMKEKGFSEAGVALVNAGGLSAAAGGLTTAISRMYTKSWPQAFTLGFFGSFLTLFFMTPQLIEKFGLKKTTSNTLEEGIGKKENFKLTEIAKQIKPKKKLVPFRQQN